MEGAEDHLRYGQGGFRSSGCYDGIDRNSSSFFGGESICSRADAGKCYRMAFVIIRQKQRSLVAEMERFALSPRAAKPVRANRVYDVPGWKLISSGYLGLPNFAASECQALIPQLWAGCPVDCAVHASAATEGWSGSVDDGIDLECCYVGANRFENHEFDEAAEVVWCSRLGVIFGFEQVKGRCKAKPCYCDKALLSSNTSAGGSVLVSIGHSVGPWML